VLARRITPGGFHSFEHRWALAEAFKLHERIGRARIASRIHALNRQLKEGLAGMRNVKVYTPAADALSAGLVCFDVAGLSPDAVVAKLAQKRIIASQTPWRSGAIRAYASLEELGPSRYCHTLWRFGSSGAHARLRPTSPSTGYPSTRP
jgi:selenocysteine lyase/cysteine desulfurase